MECNETENRNKNGFKIFFLSNNSKERLNIEVQDGEGNNLTNMIFADHAYDIEPPLACRHEPYVVLKPKCSSFVILFNDTKESEHVKFPLKVMVGQNCDLWQANHNLLFFNVNKCDDRKNFILEKELCYACGAVYAWNCCVYKIDQIQEHKWPQCELPRDAFNNKFPLMNDAKFNSLLVTKVMHLHDPDKQTR